MSNFQAVSVRVGEVRLADLVHLAGCLPSLRVLALNDLGVPVVVDVAMIEKWSSGGWTLAFACPRCSSPARVLSIHNDAAVCGRCWRRPTRQARDKNRSDWHEGQLADGLARGLLSTRTMNLPTPKGTARKLRKRSLARTGVCLALAVDAIRRADRALLKREE
jgi:hypothetical protein